MPKADLISDQLRQAIDGSELSRYRIAKETGVAEATLSRFMAGQGGLSLDGIDAIGRLLRLRLVAPANRKTNEE